MDTHFLAEFVTGEPEFRQEPWYNEYGDCVEYLCANEAVVADRVDGILTLYRSAIDDRAIGFQLKGISAIMDKFGLDKAAVLAETRRDRLVSVMLLLLAALKQSSVTGTRRGLEMYGAALQELECAVGKDVESPQPACS
ncbi:MAG: hypothetical protein FJ291_32360 [Planctomycetes bacterium]|nr:hypothetical protein [Planctomycetota bacterium]